MSTSSRDINLIVIASGSTAYFSSVKGCGQLIWDLRFGLYAGVPADPARMLDFAFDSDDWGECIDALDAPLADPVYGSTTIDFDRRLIVEDNGYITADCMNMQWVRDAILCAAEDVPGEMIPPDSVRAHLAAGRISLIPEHPGLTAQTLPADLAAAADLIRGVQPGDYYFAKLALPAGWSLTVAGHGR